MPLRVACLVALVVLATACSRSRDSDQRALLRAGAQAVDPPPADAGANRGRAPPRFDGGGEDVLTGSPTADQDRRIFDAVRRDEPADLELVTMPPLSREKFDKVRENLLIGPATFHHS